MRRQDIYRLLILAAIWGCSFMFMRIIAPVMGPLWTAEVRVGLAGAVMLGWLYLTQRKGIAWRAHWKYYLMLAAVNSALPFVLFSWAALTIPAGYSAILNATTPLWGALIGALTGQDELTPRKLAGVAVGVLGVGFLVRLGPVEFTLDVMLAVLACAVASFSYGVAGAMSKKASGILPSDAIATGSQIGSALLILPFLPFAPMRAVPTPFVLMVAALLAIFCSAIAYLIYFRLLADVGPSKAMTVTFLVPLFAILWGALLLDEPLSPAMLAGCALVVAATWLVAFKPATATAGPHTAQDPAADRGPR